MRPRAFGDLSQLADPDFLSEISDGLRHIATNVAAIDADFQALVEQNRGGGRPDSARFRKRGGQKIPDLARCGSLPTKSA